MQSLVFLTCFSQTLSKENLWGGLDFPPGKLVHGKGEKRVGSSKMCPNKMYISESEIAEENNRTTSFGEKGLLICGHIYSGSCCQVVM